MDLIEEMALGFDYAQIKARHALLCLNLSDSEKMMCIRHPDRECPVSCQQQGIERCHHNEMT